MSHPRVVRYHPLPVLARTHLAIGLGGLLMFLGTGQYMDISLAHLDGMELGPRALYRSGHIYILMCALMHLLLGAYASPRSSPMGRGVQYLASAALTAALALFIYGFWIETPMAQIERPLTRTAIELALAGTLLHCAAAVFSSASIPRDKTEPDRATLERERMDDGASHDSERAHT